jgi:hypothetical protein
MLVNVGMSFDAVKVDSANSKAEHISRDCKRRHENLIQSLNTLEVLRKLDSNKFEIEKMIREGTIVEFRNWLLTNIAELNESAGSPLNKKELKQLKEKARNATLAIRRALGIVKYSGKDRTILGGEMHRLLVTAGFPASEYLN